MRAYRKIKILELLGSIEQEKLQPEPMQTGQPHGIIMR
jgi:hypothetical protein